MKFFKIHFYVCLIAVGLLFFTACESDNEGYIALSKDLRLKAEKQGDVVSLEWTLTELPDFISYTLYHSTNKSAYENGGYYSDKNAILSSDDFFEHKFTHHSPNVLGDNYYWVEASCYGYDEYGYRTIVKSNLDSVNVSGYTAFNYFPMGVSFYPDKDVICFVDGTRKCTVYNYSQDKVLSEIQVGSYFAYPCISSYNGKSELYVAKNGNTLDVYDANDYSFVKTIYLNVHGSIYSIEGGQNGVLYVSTRYGRLYVVDRASGNTLQEIYTSDECYLKYDSENNELIASEDDSYNSVYKYTLDHQGLISTTKSIYTSSYNFPGIKINKSTNQIYLLPNVKYLDYSTNRAYLVAGYPQLHDIEFDGNTSYTAPVNGRWIGRYNNGVKQGEITMPGYPVYLFKDENRLISLFVENRVESNQLNYSRQTKGHDQSTAFGVKVIDL